MVCRQVPVACADGGADELQIERSFGALHVGDVVSISADQASSGEGLNKLVHKRSVSCGWPDPGMGNPKLHSLLLSHNRSKVLGLMQACREDPVEHLVVAETWLPHAIASVSFRRGRVRRLCCLVSLGSKDRMRVLIMAAIRQPEAM